ncbi:4'-phosphopantetheinyl transferase family protein [Streptomyces purpureus]|uniref:4'-phosphopantetheinyl transferase family protein n=1 Tax=Streptomyces purpureus TaxID=1951 RepID=UPI0037AA9442
MPGDLAVLTAEERARAGRFRQPDRGAAYAAAHAAARRCLAEQLRGSPELIRFGRRPCPGCGRPGHGRPVVEHPRTSWESSLSRSGPYWLFAATDGVRIGVDVERLRPLDTAGLNVSRLGAAVLSVSERDHLAGLEPAARGRAFMRCWTRKEAVVKASGIGIEADLRELETRPWLPSAVVEHAVDGCPVTLWSVCDLPAGPHCAAALALPAHHEPWFGPGDTTLPLSWPPSPARTPAA